jgi:uncharacterized protein YqcC (DUF446 family)
MKRTLLDAKLRTLIARIWVRLILIPRYEQTMLELSSSLPDLIPCPPYCGSVRQDEACSRLAVSLPGTVTLESGWL